ncbi:MAG TPA: hypothetical protein VG713_11325 [Pirellulales bacterium]|nr:hypothetical protein [Pirellulales bacterium]
MNVKFEIYKMKFRDCLLPAALCVLAAGACGRSDSGPPPGAPSDMPELSVEAPAVTAGDDQAAAKGAEKPKAAKGD